jgi:hypothetical protein
MGVAARMAVLDALSRGSASDQTERRGPA